jgi:multidrug transporter EmrE-like cation transporter
MSFINVLIMTAAELVGNTHLKWFADEGNHHNLVFGVMAWMAVLFFFIRTVSSASMMWTCIMWEAMIVVGGALTAWFFFGEKLTHWIQWLGLFFAVAAAVCINYNCATK